MVQDIGLGATFVQILSEVGSEGAGGALVLKLLAQEREGVLGRVSGRCSWRAGELGRQLIIALRAEENVSSQNMMQLWSVIVNHLDATAHCSSHS